MTLSSFLHLLIYGHGKTSICGRAYRNQHLRFWARWVTIVDGICGKSHCRKSFFYHMERRRG